MSRALVVAALPEEAQGAVVTGDGPIRAEHGAVEAVARFRPEALIGIGIAGGVASDLRRNDVVVARTIIDEDGVPRDCDRRLVDAAVRYGAIPVTIATTRAIVLDKSAIGADVVDMESAAWQRAAGELPFVAIRVILDPRDESLPPFLAKCARDDGSIDRGRVVRYALTHPAAIPSLIRLGKQTRDASKTLATFVSKLLASVAAIPYDR